MIWTMATGPPAYLKGGIPTADSLRFSLRLRRWIFNHRHSCNTGARLLQHHGTLERLSRSLFWHCTCCFRPIRLFIKPAYHTQTGYESTTRLGKATVGCSKSRPARRRRMKTGADNCAMFTASPPDRMHCHTQPAKPRERLLRI